MEFWIGLTLVAFLLMCVACLFEEKCEFLIYIELFIIWMVASFRYLIGADYSQYMSWYTGEVETNLMLLENLEPSFIFFIKILNEIGGSFQTIFILYESITLAFFYRGLVFFIEEKKKRMLALTLYLFLYNGFWYSMNNIRGSAAIAILFWGSQFIFKKNFIKFILSVVIATCIHYSAVFFVFLYPISFFKKKITLLPISCAIVFSICVGYFKLSMDMLIFAMRNFFSYGDKYASILIALNGEWKISSDIILTICTVLIGVMFFDKFDEKVKGCFLLSIFYCVIYISMNIQFDDVTVTDIFGRISKYLSFFYLVFLTELIIEMSKKVKFSFMMVLIMCFFYGLLFNYNLYKVGNDPVAKLMGDYLSQGNINYKFNFSIFK